MNTALLSLLLKMDGQTLTGFCQDHSISPMQLYTAKLKNSDDNKLFRAKIRKLAKAKRNEILADLDTLENL